MAHHGQQLSNDSNFASLFKSRAAEPLGATGAFPEGHLNADDEGEIRLAIGQQDGKVVIDFGKPVAWIGFTAEQAEEIANTLREHAIQARLRR